MCIALARLRDETGPSTFETTELLRLKEAHPWTQVSDRVMLVSKKTIVPGGTPAEEAHEHHGKLLRHPGPFLAP